jgi:hypothetical protein
VEDSVNISCPHLSKLVVALAVALMGACTGEDATAPVPEQERAAQNELASLLCKEALPVVLEHVRRWPAPPQEELLLDADGSIGNPEVRERWRAWPDEEASAALFAQLAELGLDPAETRTRLEDNWGRASEAARRGGHLYNAVFPSLVIDKRPTLYVLAAPPSLPEFDHAALIVSLERSDALRLHEAVVESHRRAAPVSAQPPATAEKANDTQEKAVTDEAQPKRVVCPPPADRPETAQG